MERVTVAAKLNYSKIFSRTLLVYHYQYCTRFQQETETQTPNLDSGQWCRRRGCRRCKLTHKSFGLSKIQTKSQKIRPKPVKIWAKYMKMFTRYLKIWASNLKILATLLDFEKLAANVSRITSILYFGGHT